MRHKHADLIIAWAEGATIETQNNLNEWGVTTHPYWYADVLYRVKVESLILNYRVYLAKNNLLGIVKSYKLEDLTEYPDDFVYWLSDWEAVAL